MGPQAEAYHCEADELFFGGSAGSSKTDLGLGLALTAHRRSLILRRVNKDALKFSSTDRVVGGEFAPDIDEIVLVRKPPAPATGTNPAAPAPGQSAPSRN